MGKRVLVGLTCVDEEERVIARIQTHGLVSELNEDAILLTRNDGSVFGLPPVLDLFETADPGVYTLRETDETVEDPDFLVTLTVTIVDPESLEAVTARGFMPAE